MPQRDQTISAESVRWALSGLFRPLADVTARVYVAVEWADPPFKAGYMVQCGNNHVDVAPATTTDADMRCRINVATLFARSSGQQALAEVLARGDVQVEGREDLIARLHAY